MSGPGASYTVYRVLRRGKAPFLVLRAQGEPAPGGAQTIRSDLSLSTAERLISRMERVDLESWRRREGREGVGQPDGDLDGDDE